MTTSLSYDPLGRLYEQSGGASVRRFLHAPGTSGLPELFAEFDGTGAITDFYGFGPGPTSR